MKLSWAEQAWEDYLYWQKTDKKILKRINRIIIETKRNPFEGIGEPEPLRYNWGKVIGHAVSIKSIGLFIRLKTMNC